MALLEIVVALEPDDRVPVEVDRLLLQHALPPRARGARLVSGENAADLLITELGDPPALGFAAIGQLVADHGFHVSVDQVSPYGGVRAVLAVPKHLLTTIDETAEPPSAMAAIPAPAPRSPVPPVAAVQAKGVTVAVLGGALDCLFPKENAGLARAMIECGGAVVSEYPFGRQPDRQTFPMRNRIVSGLCKGVLVVEAPLNSGTMITVGQALDQNRNVMAVPGRIDSPASQGCHKLLREGARLVTHADEVIEELQDLIAGMRRTSEAPHAEPGRTVPVARPPESVLTPEERAVLARLDVDGVPVDEVVRSSGLDAGRVNALLVGLQIKRQVRVLPGGRVARRSA